MGHIVFRPPELYPENPPGSTNENPIVAECMKLEARMLRDVVNWREPAARFEKILMDALADPAKRPGDLSPVYYAAFVARFAIGDNDWNTALRVLRLGVPFSHDNEHLLYLTRVLDRIVPPEMLEEFRRQDAIKNPNL